jgi:preprotein translocase subunit SecE
VLAGPDCKPLTQNHKLLIMSKISNYFRESYKELMEKVSWPTWPQLQQSTMIVIGATLVITGVIWVMDFAVGGVLNLIYGMFN